MQTIKVGLLKHPYPIIVGNRCIQRLGILIKRLNIGDCAYIITNTLIKKQHGNKINKALKESGFRIRYALVKDSETSKSIETASRVIRDIAAYDKQKRIFIIALGGGVIGDLAGFIASIYKRGVPYIQIPTTLLAQVDSSIGGKTALDLTAGKNLVGAFYQPRLVFSDISLLKTLNLRQLRNGLAEIIKYAAIKDRKFFTYLEKRYRDILSLKPSALEFTIARCSYIKAKVVAQDEKEERGIRTLLNFGHTIGHAIEAAQSYHGYDHGEAIGLGMLCACDIGESLGFTEPKTTQRIEQLIKATGLPTAIKKIPLARIIKAHFHDKKFVGKKNRLVLISSIGKAKIKDNIPLTLIRKAIVKRK
jgi:3-dehydroquinate synthase